MKSESSLKVFVYGTLKPGEANFSAHCDGHVKFQQKAYTKGVLYDLPFGYPAMVEGENNIEGVLLTFKHDRILNNLDRLEGYQPELPDGSNEYYRRLVPVYSLTEQFIGEAWTYFMTPQKVQRYGGRWVESNFWTGI